MDCVHIKLNHPGPAVRTDEGGQVSCDRGDMNCAGRNNRDVLLTTTCDKVGSFFRSGSGFTMSYSAKTILVFAVYLLLLGVVLVVAPNLLLTSVGAPATDEVWIRIVGVLVTVLGIYYSTAARSELRPFFIASVPVRMSVMFIFAAFAVLKFAPPTLILFGMVDFLGSVWTWVALRQETRSEARQPEIA